MFSPSPSDKTTSNATMNKLRAAVLGANDGIVSTASVVMGVAGAGANRQMIFTAGMAALVAGALSMAVGEYVSVSSQRDAEKINAKNGQPPSPNGDEDFTNPYQAAVASFIAFSIGGLAPFLATILAPEESRVLFTVLAVIISLLVTGLSSAFVGGASRIRATGRVMIGGLIAMAITYFVGAIFGSTVL